MSRPALARGVAALGLVAVVAAAGAAGAATSAPWRGLFALGGVVAATLAAAVSRPVPGAALSRAEAWAAAGLAVVAAAAVPWPAAVVTAIAPYAATSRVAAVGDAAGATSLDAGATAAAALSLAAVLLLARGARRLVEAGAGRGLARGLTLGALGHAVAALARGRYGEDDPLLLGWRTEGALTAWGTFPNRTQAAAFLLLALPAALALVLRPGRGPLRGLDRGLGVAGGVAVAASVVASGSRAGVAGLVLAAVVGAVAASRSRRARAVVVVGAAVVAVAAVAAGGERLRAAFAPRDGEATRLEIWRGTLDLAVRQPLGIGVDAFRYAYAGDGRAPQDRRCGIAENDVLQAVAETGVPGVLVLLGLAAAAVRALARDRAGRAPDGVAPGLAVAGCLAALPVALTGGGFHAPAVLGQAVLAWAVVRGLVRGGDGAVAPGYAPPVPAEAPWRAS